MVKMAFKRKYGAKRRRIGTYKSNSKRVYRKRVAKRRFTKAVKRVIMKTAEKKYYDAAEENVQLYHNVGKSVAYSGAVYPYAFYMNPLGLQQGTSSGQRIGDKIQSTGLSVKMWLSQKSDRPNVMYRILVLAYPDLDIGGLSAYIGVNQRIFYPLDAGNAMIENVQTDNFNVVYDRVIRPIAQSGYPNPTGKEHSTYHRFYIPTNRVISYRDDTAGGSTVIPKNQRDRLAMFVIPYDAWGTLVTDNIASMAYVFRHYYRDV